MKYYGNWNYSVTYPEGAIVRSMYDGRMASFISTATSLGVQPPQGPYSVSQHWGILAIDGANGNDGNSVTGSQGPQGFPGPRGIPGAQGSTGLSGMVYAGLYDATRVYRYQQVVAYNNALYVAGSVALAGSMPPSDPWIALPGYNLVPSTIFTSHDVEVGITTGSDWEASGMSGEHQFTTSIQEFITGNGMPGLESLGGMRLISGSYSATFSGTMTINLPENWNSTSLMVGASGTAQALRSSSTAWTITSTAMETTTVIFFGIQLY